MNSIKVKSIVVKTLKYSGIGVFSILFLMVITPMIFSGKLKEELKKTANERLSGKLNYSDVNVSFFKHFPSLTLTLNDLELYGSKPFQAEKFITAHEIAFKINVPSLIFGKSIDIDQIYLANSTINVKVNKQGFANYNVYIGEKTIQKNDSASTALKLEKIEIQNSHITYDDQASKVHCDIFGFNYLGKGDLSKSMFDLSSKLEINKLNVIYDNEPYMTNKKVDGVLVTKINVNSLSFVFEQNNLKINQLPVDLKGKFDFIKDGYNLDFVLKSTNSNLYDLFTAFPPKYITWLKNTDLKGKTDIFFTAKGKYEASKKLAPNVFLDLKLRDGFVNYNKSKFPVSNLNFDISMAIPSLNPDKLTVDARSFSLNIDKAFLKSKFHLKGINKPEIDASINANIDLEKLNNALGIPDFELKGLLVANGVSKGTFDKNNGKFPITNANINLKNGYIKTKYYPNPITNISINSKIDNPKGTFNNLHFLIKPAQLTFEGNPIFVDADLSNFNDLKYDVKANGTLNIGKIYQVFAQKGLDVNGTIKANIVLKGKQSDAIKGNYAKLHNNGTLEMRNIELTSENLPKKFVIKEGVFKINQDKMAFQNFTASYGQSDFKMDGYLENVINFATTKNGVLKGTFSLNSNYINADEFMSNTASGTEKTIDSKDNASKTETNSTAKGVILIPNNLDLKIDANVQKLNFKDLAMKNAKGSTTLKNGVLGIQNTGFNLIGCEVNMNANYKSINPKKAKFDYDIKATDFDIKRAYKEIKLFREMASAAEKAQGTISLEYKLKGVLNENMEPILPSIVGSGVVSVKNIKFYGMKMFNAVAKKTNKTSMKNPEMSKVEIKSFIKNNIITLERFKFKFAGFRPRIEGTTSLDGRLNLKMRLGLPPLGIFGIPLTITGNKDNPKIKIGKKTEDLQETEYKEPEEVNGDKK